jgi:UDP-N-acetylglucosamine 2-epimerase (non-hydrolysing)
VGSGSHAEQTAKVMVAFEAVLLEKMPRLVIVAGDVNSTMACAIVAAKLHIPVAHVESGLRSFDREMPEEINRVVTDRLSELLFVTEPSGEKHLHAEGAAAAGIHVVGNSMIDSLVTHRERALAQKPWQSYGLEPGRYGVLTLHRPSNVDDPACAAEIARAIRVIAAETPIVFPIHPRTLKNTGALWGAVAGLKVVEPLGYLEFLGLMAQADVVVTDSGGVQEETTALGVPCITMRRNTERPITVDEGTNRLVDPVAERILEAWRAGKKPGARVPALWDGKAAVRIVDVVERFLAERAA